MPCLTSFSKFIDVLLDLLEVVVEISSFCYETSVTISHSKDLYLRLFHMKTLKKTIDDPSRGSVTEFNKSL